ELASGWGPSIPPSKLLRPTTTPSSTSVVAEPSSIFPRKLVGTIRLPIPGCYPTTIPAVVGRGKLGKSIAQLSHCGKRRTMREAVERGGKGKVGKERRWEMLGILDSIRIVTCL
ncbi:hypothetical protein LINGRAHAP2_LOCUS31601, partial [Linum grandiflorum]